MTFVTNQPIDPKAFLFEPSTQSGALATFFGIVRNHHEGRPVERLFYECYPSMAEKEIRLIRAQALLRWKLDEARILHRVGLLEIGDVALAVAVSSAHRAESFAACREIVDQVKQHAPIWKKEFYADGQSEWVICQHSSEGMLA